VTLLEIFVCVDESITDQITEEHQVEDSEAEAEA